VSSDTSIQRINWRQALAEVTLIVAGVLIALAVDNWWEVKREREAEISYLEALKLDFLTNRESLESSIKVQQDIINNGDEILNSIKAGLSDESTGEFLSKVSNLYLFPTWVPDTGTYEDIINSGRLLYIENVQLRKELSGFRSTVASIQKFEILQTETFYERQAPFLSENQDVNFSTWSDDYRPPVSPFTADIEPFATMEYWNLVAEWIYVHVDVVSSYKNGVAHCDRILELIESELARKRK
jgi:hypothetical protein